MKKIFLTFFSAIVVSHIVFSQQPQTVFKAREIVRFYLLQDCGSGDKEPDKWLKQILSVKVEALPVLYEALQNGGLREDKEQLQKQLEDEFARNQKFLADKGLDSLKNKDILEAARKMDKETYIKMRTQSFSTGQQEKAVNALLYFKDPVVNKQLKELSKKLSLPEFLINDINKNQSP